MPLAWQESFLADLGDDAENDAVQKVEYLFTRFTLQSTAGISKYTLPAYVRSIQRITWKGYKVWPISFREMCELSPDTMVISESVKVEAPQGRPRFYSLNPSNIRDIRFYPTPNESLAVDDTKVWDRNGVQDVLCVSAWRSPDIENGDSATFVLPSYVSRRTKKAYILQQAFLKEGKGQNLSASRYYSKKYEFCVELLKRINSGHFISRKYRLSDQFDMGNSGSKPHRPILPPNFAKQW